MPDDSLWPFLVYLGLASLAVAGLMLLSWLLGQRHQERATVIPYESGVLPVGSARIRLDVRFYLVAMFFVIFDLEAVFIFAWAVALYEVGWTGYVDILIFIAVLVAALVYLWRLGALDWGPTKLTRRRMRAGRSQHRKDRQAGAVVVK